MPWFKVDDGLTSSRKWMSIPKKHRHEALGAWTWAGSWAAKELTDGTIPKFMLEEWGIRKIIKDHLVSANLWSEDAQNVYHLKWDEYQPMKADIEAEREKNREKLRNWRNRTKGVTEDVTGLQTGSQPVSNPAPDPSRPDPTKEQKTSSSDADASDPEAPEFSDEVVDLCEYLAEQIKGNGNKAPAKIGVRWLQAADRLIRIDGYTADQVRQVIDWSQRDEFWQGNILSMPKLREKFDQLKSKMFNDRARAQQQQQPVTNKSMQRIQGNVAMLRGLQTAPQVDPFEQKALGA